MVGTERNRLIGITGGIGSGKSHLCRALAERGYPVYDTDSRAKWLIVNDLEVRTEMIDLFGPEIYDGDRYCTEKVASLVFAHPALLQQLNQIVHPAVLRDVERWASSSPLSTPRSPLFVESALLFDSGLAALCDATVWVDAPLEVRIARAMRRDGADQSKIEARIRAQKNEAHRCDLVLCNDGVTPVEQLLDCLEAHIQSLDAVR